MEKRSQVFREVLIVITSLLVIITMKSSVKEYGNEIGGLLRSAGKEPASSQLGEQVDFPYFNEKMDNHEKMENSLKI